MADQRLSCQSNNITMPISDNTGRLMAVFPEILRHCLVQFENLFMTCFLCRSYIQWQENKMAYWPQLNALGASKSSFQFLTLGMDKKRNLLSGQ